jgi:hypothetical protein
MYRGKVADAGVVWPDERADEDSSDDTYGDVDKAGPGEEERVMSHRKVQIIEEQ